MSNGNITIRNIVISIKKIIEKSYCASDQTLFDDLLNMANHNYDPRLGLRSTNGLVQKLFDRFIEYLEYSSGNDWSKSYHDINSIISEIVKLYPKINISSKQLISLSRRPYIELLEYFIDMRVPIPKKCLDNVCECEKQTDDDKICELIEHLCNSGLVPDVITLECACASEQIERIKFIMKTGVKLNGKVFMMLCGFLMIRDMINFLTDMKFILTDEIVIEMDKYIDECSLQYQSRLTRVEKSWLSRMKDELCHVHIFNFTPTLSKTLFDFCKKYKITIPKKYLRNSGLSDDITTLREKCKGRSLKQIAELVDGKKISPDIQCLKNACQCSSMPVITYLMTKIKLDKECLYIYAERYRLQDMLYILQNYFSDNKKKDAYDKDDKDDNDDEEDDDDEDDKDDDDDKDDKDDDDDGEI